MIKHERFLKILKMLDESRTLSTVEIAKKLKTSEATIRRDIRELTKNGKITKVFGGITKNTEASYIYEDEDILDRYTKKQEEKIWIGKKAALLIEEKDYIYLDAGSSVEAMINFIEIEKNANYVTDSLTIAQKLSRRGINVHILPGLVKKKTDSTVGSSAVLELNKYNFNKGFFGTNGLSLKSGFSTPDYEEATVKKTAIDKCKEVYFLVDDSKFNKISGVTFCDLSKEINVITNEKDKKTVDLFKKYINIVSTK